MLEGCLAGSCSMLTYPWILSTATRPTSTRSRRDNGQFRAESETEKPKREPTPLVVVPDARKDVHREVKGDGKDEFNFGRVSRFGVPKGVAGEAASEESV